MTTEARLDRITEANLEDRIIEDNSEDRPIWEQLEDLSTHGLRVKVTHFIVGKIPRKKGHSTEKLLNKINISFVGLKYLGIFLKYYFSWFYNFFFV